MSVLRARFLLGWMVVVLLTLVGMVLLHHLYQVMYAYWIAVP